MPAEMEKREGLYYEIKSATDHRRVDTGYSRFTDAVGFLIDWAKYREQHMESRVEKIIIVRVHWQKEFDDSGMFLHEEITRKTVATMENCELTILDEEEMP